MSRFGTRYLTVAEKVWELRHWAELKREPLPEGDLAGKGYPDPDMFRWCDRINALPGICTVQSCAGHMTKDRDGVVYQMNGILWLRVSWRVAAAFGFWPFELLGAGDFIESVTTRYQRPCREVLEIIFLGNNRGQLNESMEAILSYLQRLA